MVPITQSLRSYTVPAIAAVSIADAIFHYLSEKNIELFKKALEIQSLFSLTRIALLAGTTQHLFQILPVKNNVPIYCWAALTSLCFSGLGLRIEEFREEMAQGKISFSWEKPRIYRANEWILIAQQICYMALAALSESHLIFGALSIVNLYTLFKMQSRDWLSMKKSVEKCLTGGRGTIRFEYKATFLLKSAIREEASRQVEIFLKAVEDFQVVNRARKSGDSYEVYVEKKQGLSGQKDFEQVIKDELLIYFKGKSGLWHSPKVNVCNYQDKQEVLIQQGQFKLEENQTVYGYLEDGTTVYCPNVQRDIPQKLMDRGEPIKVQIIGNSKEIRNGKLYFECVSEALPKQERVVIERIVERQDGTFVKFEYEVLLFSKEGICPCCSDGFKNIYSIEANSERVLCKECVTTDTEKAVNRFEIINQPRRIAHVDVNMKETQVSYEVYALKEMLPEGEMLSENRLSIWVDDNKLGWCPAEILWREYPPGRKLRVIVKDVENRTAYGQLKDGTTVCLPKIISELANEIIAAGKPITVEVKSHRIENGHLRLTCTSEAFIPKTKTVVITNALGSLKFFYSAIFNPKLLGEDEDNEPCVVCCEVPEVAYYTCSNQKDVLCKGCLEEALQESVNNFEPVNKPGLLYNLEIGRVSLRIYLQKEMLPKCSFCRENFASETQLSVSFLINEEPNFPVDIVWLDYKEGQQIQVSIQGFTLQLSAVLGTLPDGTIVEFLHVQPRAALHLLNDVINSGRTINAQICSKHVSRKGQLYLFCSSEELPKGNYSLNQEHTFTIEKVDQNGIPYADLPSGERAYFHGKAEIGNQVTGYFWEQVIRSEFIALEYLPCKKDMEIQFRIIAIDKNGPIEGELENGQKIVLINLSLGEWLFHAIMCKPGTEVSGYVACTGKWANGEFVIICTPEDRPVPNLSFF